MTDSFNAFCAGVMTAFIGMSLFFLVLVAATDTRPAHKWHAEAIKSGVGEYNNKTGKFQWVNVKPETVCE